MFIASGAVLVLEVVGLRLVGPYLGVTLQTSSAVIGIALAAIAYGAWTGGFLADRVDPRRMLAPAFLLAAVVTGLTLPLVRWAGEILRGSSGAGTLLLTALAVFVPAALLSAITPMVVKLQLRDVQHTGRIVGRLSGIGTLGGITATLGTGFVLVAALPTSAILLSLAVLLALCGVGLYLFQRRQDPDSVTPGRRTAAAAVIGLAGVGLSLTAPNPCDVETAYHCATVVPDAERPNGRLLLLNSARHSYVDLADPTYLEFAYARWFGAFVDEFRPAEAPIRALHVGGGGFTMPGYVAATRPGSFNRVLELDGALVELDERELGVRRGPLLDIQVGDARTALAQQPSGDMDLVIGDAFGHLAVPWHLTTQEFVRDIRRVLRSDGAYILNVIDYPPSNLVKAEIATIQSVFPHVALITRTSALDGKTGANFDVLASGVPLPLEALQDRVDLLNNTFPGEEATLLSGAELTAFVGDAAVLTDDYAPVDQLLTLS